MTNVKIKKAEIKDIDKIMEVIDSAKEYLKERGVDQWQNGFPTRNDISCDMENFDSSEIIVSDMVAGFFLLSDKKEESYDKISGGWKSDKKYATIHRTAIRKEYRNLGLSKLFFDKAEIFAKERCCDSIRVDTHKDNEVMKRLLEKNGYRYCGEIQLVRSGEMRIGFEKVITK